ncbi:MAG: MlaD family protein [Candidatus Omnitrophica bacterium]|nr:MlaD family protein [Candidatus Omnitrophota bacterium]MCF7893332.1 MlaD family protein [Candidatus Omnitrophota bacterium]
MKKYGNEFKVGLFFLICIIGLAAITFKTGKVSFKKEGYNLYVIFNEVAGLDVKAPVMLNGYEVGEVEDVKVVSQKDRTHILLKLLIDPGVKIRINPKVSIKTLGMMGEKYIQITSHTGKGFLKPDSRLEGKPYIDMDDLIDNVNNLTEEVKKLTNNLNHTVKGNQDKISRMISNLETTSKNLEEFTADIKSHPWKLLFKK